MTTPAQAILANGLRRSESEPRSEAPTDPKACESCGGHGHLVDRWVGGRWLSVRGCNACGWAEKKV